MTISSIQIAHAILEAHLLCYLAVVVSRQNVEEHVRAFTLSSSSRSPVAPGVADEVTILLDRQHDDIFPTIPALLLTLDPYSILQYTSPLQTTP